MKVKDLVKKLNEYIDKYGDHLEVVISTDEEGNSYSTVEIDSLALVRNESKPVGIVIYPWEEGFNLPEEACAGEHYEEY